MLLRFGIAFSICAVFFHLAKAEVYCLLYDNDDLPLPKLEFVTVRYCYRPIEQCCGTECCDRPDRKQGVILAMILCATGLIIGISIYCWKCLIGRTIDPNTTNSFGMNTSQAECRRDIHPDLEIHTNLWTNRHEVDVQESNSHSTTPPPDYNVAIWGPSAPTLLPESRIPSYEDVMAGRTT